MILIQISFSLLLFQRKKKGTFWCTCRRVFFMILAFCSSSILYVLLRCRYWSKNKNHSSCTYHTTPPPQHSSFSNYPDSIFSLMPPSTQKTPPLKEPSIKFRSTYAIFSLPINVSLILLVFIILGQKYPLSYPCKICLCVCDEQMSILFSLENANTISK